ncbi:MAG: hypothetical protein HZA51_15390 [Planctomycetes bacterium]|nr:hypothetical protein [Planctomycetota bacterium]
MDDDIDDMHRFGGDDPPEMMCPQCRGVVTEDTPKCPHCGEWITPVDPEHAGPRKLIYILAALVMLLVSLLMTF